MPQNLLSQKNMIIGAVLLVVILGGGYAYYSSTQDGSGSASSGAVNPSLFRDDVKNFYLAKDKINFANLSFMKKPFYTHLRDGDTVEIPIIKPAGRPNPFVPYVTP